MLRPGNVKAHEGALVLLRRTVAKLRKRCGKQVKIRVRLAGGYACAEVLECLEALGVEYVVSIGKNRALEDECEPVMEKVRERAAHSGESERVCGECRYEARSWEDERRVVYKAEVTLHPGREPRDNPQFVVTNLRRLPEHVYAKVYCQRAQTHRVQQVCLYPRFELF